MPIWPAAVPFIEAEDGFSLKPQAGGKLRTQMSGGPVKQRRRTSAMPTDIRGKTPPMSEALFQTFSDFYHTTLSEGSLEFTAPHPITGADGNFRFVDDYELSIKGSDRILTLTVEHLNAI